MNWSVACLMVALTDTHRWRKDNPHKIRDFKPEAIHKSVVSPVLESLGNADAEPFDDAPYDDLRFEEDTVVSEETDCSKVIELKLASVLLKLEHSYLVPSEAS